MREQFELVSDRAVARLLEAGYSAQRLTGAGILLVGAAWGNVVFVLKRGTELETSQLNWLERWAGPWRAVDPGKDVVQIIRLVEKQFDAKAAKRPAADSRFMAQ